MARASFGSVPALVSFRLPRLSPQPISAVHVAAASIPMADAKTPHPSIEVIGGGRDLFLPAFKTINHPYTPFPFITKNRHVETIFASLLRTTPYVRYKRECIRTKDDGAVALDWVAGDSRRLSPDSPVLILLPGLTGGSEDSYVRHMLVRAKGKGWRVVVFNSRGCGNSPVTTPLFYSASFLGDMREVVALVTTRYPNAKIYAVGWSLGANILVNYLGQESQTCPLAGAVSLCNPFDLVIADEDFRKGFNIVYDKALTRALCRIFQKHAYLFEDMDGEYDISSVTHARSVREFDQGLTRVSFGFKSVDDYYSKSSSSDAIKHVCRPLLCIQTYRKPSSQIAGCH
ncbi:embryogenesis-associated protein EMB8 isoform X2 [Jatropha curcas]|uniref:embryogenesis-associated protein EMB8 isoform X2 n=1 Tax=Jatropha curcas TaxID=180498 RepID=UPI0009D734AE|nr:embryogenesis-associated protein EMB8 isoform X2 [Jatropha curcas]